LDETFKSDSSKPEDREGEELGNGSSGRQRTAPITPQRRGDGSKPLKPRRSRRGEGKRDAARGDFKLRQPKLPGDPLILPRTDHIISRKEIDPDALKVMRRLIRHGYKAYMVGGGVRDLLLSKAPKDYDVSTDARPEEVRTLFRNSRIIGRRFRINHVYFRGNKIIEVSTFRASSGDDSSSDPKMLLSDNTYGDPQTDAVRRDLTINGLFYDLSTFSLIDYVGGIEDLKDRVIRIIGLPVERFKEDPVRMIRAIRHAARAGFKIEPQTYQAICEQKALLHLASKVRVYEEFMRELRGGESLASMKLLHQTGLLPYLLPALHVAIEEDAERVWKRLERVLTVFDEYSRTRNDELSASLIFCALFVGNFPQVLQDEFFGDKKSRPYLDYWLVTPVGAEDPEEEDIELEEKPVSKVSPPLVLKGSETASSRRRTRHRGKTTRLGLSISRIFEEAGVSRKERERMEQLLVARYVMIQSADEALENSLSEKSYFHDALLLLRCTAHSELAQQRLDYWEQRTRQFSSRTNVKRKRSRRRGGRRKGSKN